MTISFARGVVAIDPVPPGGTTGQVLSKASNADFDTEWTAGGGGGSGTVTSVAMTVPTGLTVTGSPITTSGTLAVSLATGYSIPTTASQTNWDTAYSLASTAVQPAAIANMLETSDIGVSVQAYDVDLTAWAGVSTSAKQDTLVSGTNIKSVNSTSLLGSGDLALFAGGLIQVKVVATLPGSPDANTLYIVTT